MKKMMVVFAMVLAAAVMADDKETITIVEARQQIAEAATDGKKMDEIMSKLQPAADQVVFLKEINEALAQMPGSNEAKADAFVTANRQAIVNCDKSVRSELLAVTFSTVPVEYLTAINENFGHTLFSRDMAKTKVSDEDFTKVAQATVKKIAEACVNTENADVRITFAILMFAHANVDDCNSFAKELTEKLVSENIKNADTQKMANDEWIKSALGYNTAKTYDPMLGAAGAGEIPGNFAALAAGRAVTELNNVNIADARLAVPVNNMASVQGDLLFDLQNLTVEASTEMMGGGLFRSSTPIAGQISDAAMDQGLNRLPRPRSWKAGEGSAGRRRYDNSFDPTSPSGGGEYGDDDDPSGGGGSGGTGGSKRWIHRWVQPYEGQGYCQEQRWSTKKAIPAGWSVGRCTE